MYSKINSRLFLDKLFPAKRQGMHFFPFIWK